MAHLKKINLLGAVIGRWIHLHLPSFDPGFDPRAKNLCILYLNLKVLRGPLYENWKTRDKYLTPISIEFVA